MNPRILVWVLVAAAALPAQEPPERVGRLSYVYGAVSLRPGGQQQWAAATLNYPLSNGDRLRTDRDAQAEAQVGATAVHLAPQSTLSVLLLDGLVFRMELSQGAINVRIPRLNEGESVEVQTAYGLFRLAQTGSYRVDASPDAGFVSITARSGTAEAVAEGQKVTVAEGQRLVLSGSPVAADLLDAPEPDPWDEWCASRDELAERSLEMSQEYVSWEIAGAEELAQYGDWASDDTAGPYWRPRGLPAGWAPYRFGHWIYKPPWGWTWVDDAPWGFAPTHFGRWTRSGDAWVWTPDPRRHHAKYSAAQVAFSSSKGSPYIAWIPLSPRDSGSGRNRAYANRDAVTTAPLSTFTGARPVAPARLALFDRGTAVFSQRAPDVAPTRESALGGRPAAPPAVERQKRPDPAVPVESERERRPPPQGVEETPRGAERRTEESDPARPRAAEPAQRLVQDDQRRAEESRQQDEQRRAEESRRQDEERRAEDSRRQDDQRRAEDSRRQDDQRRAEESRRQDEQRRAEEGRRQDEQRRAEEGRRQDEQRRAEEGRRQDEQRRAEEGRRQDEQRRAEESRRQDDQRRAEEGRKLEEQRKQEADAREARKK